MPTWLKRRDQYGVVHYARRASSVFTLCTKQRPTMDDHTIPLVYPGTEADDAVVTCLACLVIE